MSVRLCTATEMPDLIHNSVWSVAGAIFMS